jgi:hypothetical protein
MSALARWLELLAPGAGDFVRGPFEALTLMPVYRVPPGCAPTVEGATFQCAEFSLRACGGEVDQARMMAALWAPWVRPGGVAAALQRLAPDATPDLLAALEQLRADHPQLDLLVGMDAGGAVRGKLYVMRATPDDPIDLGVIAERALALVGVAPSWVRRSLDEMVVEPAFFALDLCGERTSGGKLYFAFERAGVVRAHLERLGADWLVERLDAVVQQVSDNPVGRWVITLRGRGDRTVDVTLHAHLARLPPLSGPVERAWERLRSLARAELGRELTPSYVSWMQAEQRVESLYYQVGLTQAELSPEVAPILRGGRIRPNQGLDGGRAGPVYLSEVDLAKLAQGAAALASSVPPEGVGRGGVAGGMGAGREGGGGGEGVGGREVGAGGEAPAAREVGAGREGVGGREVGAGREASAVRESAAGREAYAAREVSAAREVGAGREASEVRETSAAREVGVGRESAAGREAYAAREVSAAREVGAGREASQAHEDGGGREVGAGREASQAHEDGGGRESAAARESAAGREASGAREDGGGREASAVRESAAGREASGAREVGAGREASAVRESATGREASGAREGGAGREVGARREASAAREGGARREDGAGREAGVAREDGAAREGSVGVDPRESALRLTNMTRSAGEPGRSGGPGAAGHGSGAPTSAGLRPGPDGTPGGRRPGPDSREEVPVPGPVGFPGFPRPRRTRPPGKEAP